MAKTNWTTIGLAAAAVAGVWFATRKKSAAAGDGGGGGLGGGASDGTFEPSIPAHVKGDKLDGCSHPRGVYSEADGDRILEVVRKWVRRHPVRWDKPGDIVQPARDAARHVFAELCPDMPFPAVGEDYKIDNYAAVEGPAWANLYDLAFQFAYDMILDADF